MLMSENRESPGANDIRQKLPLVRDSRSQSRSTVIRGLYSAAGGMHAASIQQDATAHNLSHAMKPGYRREIIRFDSVVSKEDIASPTSSLHTDYSQGVTESTGNKLDLAIDGPGFFSVEGPNGPLYTKTGVFQLNAQGQIVTPDGLRVSGASGPIAVPLDGNFDRLEVTADGTVALDGVALDQVKVTAFENPAQLQRAGSSYFMAPPDAALSRATSEVRQGYRELSNTTVVSEMVQMLAGSRQFEAAQRALRQISETIALNTRPK